MGKDILGEQSIVSKMSKEEKQFLSKESSNIYIVHFGSVKS